MPRTPRASQGGYVYHVLNRGNGRADVFHKHDDYASFVCSMCDANEKVPMRLVGYCLMSNHFHLLLWPHGDGDLSEWMQWLMAAQVRRYHAHYHGSGHIWQGRFKSFPVQDDDHYLTVLRYVERNPLRANLVERSEDWVWSSVNPIGPNNPEGLLSAGPVAKPKNWVQIVNDVQTDAELKDLRQSVERGTPFGSTEWQKSTVTKLGLELTLPVESRPKSDDSSRGAIPRQY